MSRDLSKLGIKEGVDVVCGVSGAEDQRYNEHYRSLIRSFSPGYVRSRNSLRRLMADEICSLIESNGGRFINITTLKELSPKLKIDKIRKALKDQKMKSRVSVQQASSIYRNSRSNNPNNLNVSTVLTTAAQQPRQPAYTSTTAPNTSAREIWYSFPNDYRTSTLEQLLEDIQPLVTTLEDSSFLCPLALRSSSNSSIGKFSVGEVRMLHGLLSSSTTEGPEGTETVTDSETDVMSQEEYEETGESQVSVPAERVDSDGD